MDKFKKFVKDHQEEIFITTVSASLTFAILMAHYYKKDMRGMMVHGAEVHKWSDGREGLLIQFKNGKYQFLNKLGEDIVKAA